MKKKWIVFAAAVLFLAAAGLGLYLGTPSIPKRGSEKSVPVQSVASITGYAKKETLRNRFLGVVSQAETVTVRLDEGRETDGFLVDAGDRVREGSVLAVYNNASLLLEKEQFLLDREQIVFDMENTKLQIRTLKKERDQAEAARRGELDLQILNVQAELEQKEYELVRKDREIAGAEEKLSISEVVSPCEGIVTEADREGGSLSIVPEETYELRFSVSEEELKDFQAGDAVVVMSRDESISREGTVDRVESGNPGEGETASGAARASMYPVHGIIRGADGFLPGQHVYVEKKRTGGEQRTESEEKADNAGKEEVRKNEIGEAEILLPEGYIEETSGKPWVWVAGRNGCLEKRLLTLGAYNDRQNAWQVAEGLSMTDYLAWPSALLEEGQKADFGE